MFNTIRSTQGMAVAPHALAAQSAVAVLRDGGNAIEAMIAAAACISVVYPHMNGIGGDAFWIIAPPREAPIAIDAAGPAGQRASIAAYRQAGLARIPHRGPQAMNTVAGAVGSWNVAYNISRQRGGRLDLRRLLRDAIDYAADGIAVTASQARSTRAKFDELVAQPGFAERFLLRGEVPEEGARLRQPRIAAVLEQLAGEGLDAFYRGALARAIAADLAEVGAVVQGEDLAAFHPRLGTPVTLDLRPGRVFNTQPPTQGVISLAILKLLELAGIERVAPDGADHIHLCVEATKQAFKLRDAYLTDLDHMQIKPEALLDARRLAALAQQITLERALPWGGHTDPGDTVWMGVIDRDGLAVSFIQSIYHEFGSGIVLPRTGINWQNRGASFSLDARHINALQAGKRPFHTLNPAAARLNDGRIAVYGTMGGDGQPQTQAAVFSRAVWFAQPLQQAITAPRWLLGRTWGMPSESLKLERRFSDAVAADLRARGHEVEWVNEYDETMGHAGIIVRSAEGILAGAADPRSDGLIAAY